MPDVHISISFGEATKAARDMLDTEDTGKTAKSDVEYRDAANLAECCRKCECWEGSDQDTEASCKKVGGEVEGNAVCNEFSPVDEPEDEAEPVEEKDPEPVGEPPEPAKEQKPPLFGGAPKPKEHE